MALRGSLTNVGPLDALIAFPEPLRYVAQHSPDHFPNMVLVLFGKAKTLLRSHFLLVSIPSITPLNHLIFCTVCAAANTGVPDYVTSGRLTITDSAKFTDFATFLLHNPDFTWTISTPKLRLTALGTIFDNVTLSKDVTFKAFNGLPGVTISNFQLPSDDPAGGIHIETDAEIPSPARSCSILSVCYLSC